MDFLLNPDFWRNLAIGMAVLDVAALGLLIWLGYVDERDEAFGP